MMMLKVSHMLAKANQENISEKMLYFSQVVRNSSPSKWVIYTHKGLNMEENHADNAMTRLV
jgi:hypothetical protein